MARRATNLEERVNHEDFSGRDDVQHVGVAQVMLENREMIDQPLDDQMNHNSKHRETPQRDQGEGPKRGNETCVEARRGERNLSMELMTV